MQGASPRELLLEACRRNNVELLSEVLASQPKSSKATPDLLNNARDGVGNYCLHVAATYGSCEPPTYHWLNMILKKERLP